MKQSLKHRIDVSLLHISPNPTQSWKTDDMDVELGKLTAAMTKSFLEKPPNSIPGVRPAQNFLGKRNSQSSRSIGSVEQLKAPSLETSERSEPKIRWL